MIPTTPNKAQNKRTQHNTTRPDPSQSNSQHNSQHGLLWKIIAVCMLAILINTSVVTALEISGVTTQDVTQNSATVTWQTDTPADSFIEYAPAASSQTDTTNPLANSPQNPTPPTNQPQFIRKGDADAVTTHQLILPNLDPQTTYQFKVQSGPIIDDAQGSFYSFQTLAPDIATSSVTLTIPAIIQGTSLSFNGTAENGAAIKVLVNGHLGANAQAKGPTPQTADGTFVVTNVHLDEEKDNLIFVQATDSFGNTANTTSIVYADSHKPQITLLPVPELIGDKQLILNGSLSENSSIEVFVNNRSVEQQENLDAAQPFSLSVDLQEGQNALIIRATDRAGWVTEKILNLKADIQVPTLRAEIEKGYQYYETRAESSISGETESGAKVYLYIYRPEGQQYTPDFSRAVTVVTADQNGSFRFKDVDFSLSLRSQLTTKKLTPRQVPSELAQVSIFPIQEQLAAQQQVTYFVYIIAEDSSGKSVGWQRTVNVNSCSSGDLAFGLENMAKFQQPYRLNPTLLDDGRQEIQTVFKFNYLGQGTPTLDASGNQYDRNYKITNVRIEPACTQAMKDDTRFGIGCQLLPGSTRPILGPDAVYATWTLIGASKFSKKEDKFWNDFKKRQIVFPLKVTIEYQEKSGNKNPDTNEEQWSQTKTQTSCQDIGYFVDIPLESKDLIPDFIANDGVAALNKTIDMLQTARGYVETAYIITGVSCIASFLGRWVSRGIRVATSRLESYFEFAKPQNQAKQKGGSFDETGKCPINQNNLYLRSTLENWYEMYTADPAQYGAWLPGKVVDAFNAGGLEGDKTKDITLDELCDSTATAWKFEAALDQAYRWTCDRAFCRAVPAGWTEDKTEEAITKIIQAESSCAVTGRGVPLKPLENCQDHLKADATHLVVDAKDVGNCWTKGDGSDVIYYKDPNPDFNADSKRGIFHLRPANKLLGGLVAQEDTLIVYQPPDSEGLIAGRDVTCQEVCSDPYKGAFTDQYKFDKQKGYFSKGCYKEKNDDKGIPQLYDQSDKILGSTDETPRYAAGYTKDCFIQSYTDTREPEFYQCVCTGTPPTKQTHSNDDRSLRTAVEANKFKQGVEEKWSYREERIYKENKGRVGTYYPEIRYYSGRDLSGAFGQDYVTDYLPGEKKVAKVDPHAGFIESVQTMCTSGILKHMVMLESILVGLRNCLVEAKYTGLYDAGACKTWFTQNVCGLVYKGIASMLSNSCTPSNFDDVGKGGAFEDVGVIVKEGTRGMTDALQSSVSDIKADYGNAELNNYFQGGAQGFAQSMCMAAFGFDFPLFSKDFLLDAAYAFPTHTSVVVAPAFRELSTFNPARQTAIHNYEIGAVIMPGCKITRAVTSLKCIGPEDRGFYGVDLSCNGKGCDCLLADPKSEFAGEREKIIHSDMSIASGRMFSVPIDTPQRIDSHFRYDHVKVEVEIDPAENPELCFDKEVAQGRKGVWYFPITDTTPELVGTCSVDAVSGRYNCPELSNLFGAGQAAIESPYMECHDARTDRWVNCQTPNLFILGDDVRVRLNLALNGKGMCLKRTIRNLPGVSQDAIFPIPDNVQGTFKKEDSIAIVRSEMFGGVSNLLQTVGKGTTQSNNGCPNSPTYSGTPDDVHDGTEFLFGYTPVTNGAGKVTVSVPADATLTPQSTQAGYSVSAGSLALSNVKELTVDQANQASFNVDGFTLSNAIGRPELGTQPLQCTYRVAKKSVYANEANSKEIQVVYELYEHDEGGGCTTPTQIAKPPAIGKNRHVQQVRIQKTATAVAEVGGLHDVFMQDNYNRVHQIAIGVFKELGNDMTNALALYYDTLAFVMKGKTEKNDVAAYKTELNNLLKYFFGEAGQRNYAGQPAPAYGPDVTDTTDYKKISIYLCEVDKKINGDTTDGKGLYCNAGTLASAKRELAGKCDSTIYDKSILNDDYIYQCKVDNKAAACNTKTGRTNPVFVIPANHALFVLCNTSTSPTAPSPASPPSGDCTSQGFDKRISGDTTWAYKCLTTTTASSCTIATNVIQNPSFIIPSGNELITKCASTPTPSP